MRAGRQHIPGQRVEKKMAVKPGKWHDLMMVRIRHHEDSHHSTKLSHDVRCAVASQCRHSDLRCAEQKGPPDIHSLECAKLVHQ